MKLSGGSIVRIIGETYPYVYIYSQVGTRQHTLINIYNGNRYTDDSWEEYQLTLEELNSKTDELWEYVGRLE